MRAAHRPKLRAKPAVSIDQMTVCIWIDERAIIVLAVDFDEFARNSAQSLKAHRLIVDESAGAAVSHLHAPQNQLAFGLDILLAGNGQRGVLNWQIKNSGHLALRLALPDEAAVTARAQSQGKGIKEDRFTSTRLTSQNGESAPEFQVEPVDQHNVADGELNQHESKRPLGHPAERA